LRAPQPLNTCVLGARPVAVTFREKLFAIYSVERR